MSKLSVNKSRKAVLKALAEKKKNNTKKSISFWNRLCKFFSKKLVDKIK